MTTTRDEPGARLDASPAAAGRPTDRTPGFVLFRLGERMYATPLSEVREVVRLGPLAQLPAMAAPLAGVLDLRGRSLPVLDIRPAGPARLGGDVLVLGARGSGSEPVGFAVDSVTAVVPDLPGQLAGGPAGQLPAYVEQVRSDDGKHVFLVDVRRMIELVGGPARAARPRAKPSTAGPAGPAQDRAPSRSATA